jgi:integrase
MGERTGAPGRGNLVTVVEEMQKHLVLQGYSRSALRRFGRTWRQLAQFAAGKEVDSLSFELTEAFLKHCGVGSSSPEAPAASGQRHLMFAMWILWEFHQHGCFPRRRSATRVHLSDTLSHVLEGYLRFSIQELRIRPRTMRGRRQHVTEFLVYLASRGTLDLRSIDVPAMSGFVASRGHCKSRTLALLVSDLRSFLCYLAMQGVVAVSLADRLPNIRVRWDDRIPDVWRAEDIAVLLGAVDRGSPVGRRDYAILLLAARLGMRVGDIRDLTFDDLRWDQAAIVRVQAKTGVPVVLPLTEEIGEALIAYLRDGRPPSARREVFLRHLAPFEPFGPNDNLYHLITTYRRRAGIELPQKSRKGLHSLRHTVATRLLEAGVALDTISGVLGHASAETTRIYTKVDLAALRSAALEIEEAPHV